MTSVVALAPSDTTQNRCVLVVDDDQGILDTYSDILAPRPHRFAQLKSLLDVAELPTSNFELSIANQGEAAVELVRARSEQNMPYGVAFIDMRMPPGMDGLATAKAIRAIDARIFIVIVTAYSDHSLGEINRQLGHDVLLLRKPFTDDELLQIARVLIEIWNREGRCAQYVGTEGHNTSSTAMSENKSHTHALKEALLSYLCDAVDTREWYNKSLHECLSDYETFIIRTVLEGCGGHQSEAAKILGIQPNTLHCKLKRQALSRHEDDRIVTLHGIKAGITRSSPRKTLEQHMQDFEKKIIKETLTAAKHNHLRAAMMLEISLIGLLTKMRQYGLR